MMLNIDSRVEMNDGQRIPLLGFGVFEAAAGDECENAVLNALEAGYRHIDTAHAYGNEESVGRALERSGVPREDIFVTTKTGWDHNPTAIERVFNDSLDKLRTDYVDLFLVHWPLSDAMLPELWGALESLRANRQCRSIGVSNFTVRRLNEALLPKITSLPAINQIEMHVFNQERDVVQFCRDCGIMIEAYSPLARAKFLDRDTLAEIADALGKSPAQIMIRFLLQQGVVCLPKSTTPARIKQNADVFDFELDEQQMALLTAMDEARFVRNWAPEGYY